MTKERLHLLLYECAEMRKEDRLSEVCAALEARLLLKANFPCLDALWQATLPEQVLFALCYLIDHAGRNGLTSMWFYEEENAVPLMACVVEALDLIGEEKLHHAASAFMELIVSRAKTSVPSRFSEAKISDYEIVQEALWDAFMELYNEDWTSEFNRLDNVFLSCWKSTLPESALIWLRRYEELLGERICEP